MNFGKQLITEILTEAGIKNVIAIYPGRFQPLSLHHAKTFKWIQSKFGAKNSYIATSDKVEIPKSPFNFNEKKKIINKYGFSNVVKVKNPYIAKEVVSKFDPDTTAVVFVVGKKDASRLSGSKFYREWNNKPDVTYRNGVYYLIAPHISLTVSGYGGMDGTTVRRALGDKSKSDKKDLFKSIFGFFDKSIYNLVVGKLEALNEIMSDFSEQLIESSNITKLGKSEVDDGPRHFYGNQKTYRTKTEEMALRLGFEVVNYLIGKEEFEIHDTDFPEGPPQSVTYFPVGLAGVYGVGTNYFKDMKGQPAFYKWSRNIMRIVQATGFEFITFLGAEKSIESSKQEPTKEGDSLVTENLVEKPDNRILLTCGGGYGHMNHPFDDNNLTFGDFKQLITGTLSGNIDVSTIFEKSDGINLFVTHKNGKLFAARNKGQIKNPITAKQVAKQFAGRGDIKDAFVFAMNDLEKAIGSLSEKQITKIFNNGKNFMNLEIIYPKTKNVIDYDKTVLQFHGAQIYDDNGNSMGEVPDSGRILAGMIKQVNADVQKHFNIIPPKILKLGKSKNFGERASYFLSKLNKLQKKFKLKDTDTLGMYHQAWWQDVISKKANSLKYPIPNKILTNLVKRWAFFDKSYKISNIKKDIDNEEFLNWALDFDKTDHKDMVKKNIEPFEHLFLELGVEVLKNIEGFLSANPDKTVQDIRNQVAKEIKNIKLNGSPDQIKKLETQLKKIQAIGGFSGIVPSEGIVLKWNGKIYKITGLFAPIGQLTGIMKYAR